MIVVDTNVIAYLFLQGEFTQQSKSLLRYDSEWIVPRLWRSEFRNVLAFYIRKGAIKLEDAQLVMHEAELFLQNNEYEVNSNEILEHVSKSDCSAYDCEFVALARKLNVKLYTSDRKVLKEFPTITKSLASFK